MKDASKCYKILLRKLRKPDSLHKQAGCTWAVNLWFLRGEGVGTCQSDQTQEALHQQSVKNLSSGTKLCEK